MVIVGWLFTSVVGLVVVVLVVTFGCIIWCFGLYVFVCAFAVVSF